MTVQELRDAVVATGATLGAVLGLGGACDELFASLAEDIALTYAQAVVHP
ncbi:hypothetical protein ACFVH4_18990 [Nocardia ignorata]